MASSSSRFRFIDLLVTIGIALALLACLPAIRDRAGRSSNRIKCASNLRTIGQGLFMYANEHGSAMPFPQAAYIPDAPPTAWTAPTADPKSGVAPGPNDVTAALYLVLRTQDIAADIFVCPSTDADRLPGNTQTMSNFDGQSHLSYSYQNPYPSSAAVTAGFALTANLNSTFALMADMNPGTPELLTITPQSRAAQMRLGNSPNHSRDGQNVLYADGHVDWNMTPFCGGLRDNIYTYGSVVGGVPVSLGINGSPVDASDSILLPAWDQSVPMPTVEVDPRRPERIVKIVVFIALAIVAAVVAAACIFTIVRRRRAESSTSAVS